MDVCHAAGAWGVHVTEGKLGHMVCWDSKCRDLHLCPHEARENQARLVRAYVPHVAAFVARSPFHRVHYGVFTVRNVPLGRLREGRAGLMQRFASWLSAKRRIEPEDRQRHPGIPPRCRTMHTWRPNPWCDDGIVGALVHVEDPLSADGRSWNIHCNVMLLTRGAVDYGAIRASWGSNVHLAQVQGDAEAIRLQMCELVKYSAKQIGRAHV